MKAEKGVSHLQAKEYADAKVCLGHVLKIAPKADRIVLSAAQADQKVIAARKAENLATKDMEAAQQATKIAKARMAVILRLGLLQCLAAAAIS